MKMWWFLFLLDLTVIVFAIVKLINGDFLMSFIFSILAIILAIIFKLYDNYINTDNVNG